MAIRIQKRRGTAAAWTAANPILADGEEGYESDTKKLKIGDGVTAWSALSYRVSDPSSVAITGGTMTGVKARILDSRLRSHLYNSGYLQPAPAWVATTAYTYTQAVTANGNTYVCQIGGTSGSTAPSAVTPGFVVDGSVSWYYFGPAPTTDASAPTMTAGASTPGSFTATKLATDQSWYDIYGGTYTMTGGLGPQWAQSSEPINTGGLCIEFLTDSPDFIAQWKFGANPVRVAVEGKFVSPTTYSGSATFQLRMAFPASVRKTRRISLFYQGSNAFTGVISAPTDRFWRAPTPVQSFKLFVVGDSIFGGSSNHPSTIDRLPHHILAEMLGAKQYQTDAVGGSGYLTPGSGVVFNTAVRLARIPAGQDVIVVAGGINDPAGVALQPAVTAYLRALRSVQPTALIFVLGPWAGTLGPDANTLSKEASILAAVSAVADSNIVFVPVNTDTSGAWVFGTGNVGAQNASGNTDVYISSDGTHQTCLGSDYLMGRIADAIRAQIRPALT